MVCRYDIVYVKILTRSWYYEFCQNFRTGIYRALTSRGLASYFSSIWRIQVTFNGPSSGKLSGFFSRQCTTPVTVLGHRTMQLVHSACSNETMPNTYDWLFCTCWGQSFKHPGASWQCNPALSRRTATTQLPGPAQPEFWGWPTCSCATQCTGLTSVDSGTTWMMHLAGWQTL